MVESLSSIKEELLSSPPLRELETRFQEVINFVGGAVCEQMGVYTPGDLERGSVQKFLEKRKPESNRWLLMFTGPHGAGKTSVLNALEADPTYHRVLNHTTRSAREGEKNGGAVIHVSEEEYTELERHGLLVTDNFYPGRGHFGLTSTELERGLESNGHLLMEKRVTSSAPVLEWLKANRHPITPQHFLVLAPSFDVHVERILRRDFFPKASLDIEAASLAIQRQLTEEKFQELHASAGADAVYLVNDQVTRVTDLVKAVIPQIQKDL